MRYVESAFDAIIPDAMETEEWYVCLMESTSRYIGPEEGGTWSHDSILIKYKECVSEKQAEQLKEKIEKLAEELTQESINSHGEYCLRTMEWLDERGLDADFLPEPDGPSKFYVLVCNKIPSNSYGPDHYE